MTCKASLSGRYLCIPWSSGVTNFMAGSALQHANMYDVHHACPMVLEQATYNFCRASCCAGGKVTAGRGGPEQVRPLLVLPRIGVCEGMPHVTTTERYAKLF